VLLLKSQIRKLQEGENLKSIRIIVRDAEQLGVGKERYHPEILRLGGMIRNPGKILEFWDTQSRHAKIGEWHSGARRISQRPIDLGTPLPGYGAKLTEQLKSIVLDPVLRQLAAGEPPDDDDGPGHLAAGRGDPFPIPALRGMPAAAPHALVAGQEESGKAAKKLAIASFQAGIPCKGPVA
jgi:hypothetical protein